MSNITMLPFNLILLRFMKMRRLSSKEGGSQVGNSAS